MALRRKTLIALEAMVALTALVLVVAASSATLANAQPIDVLDQLGTESRRMFYKMLEVLGDYDEFDDDGGYPREEAGSPSLLASNRVEVAGREEQCKLPPRRGECRALLPRWRYDPGTKSCREFKFGGCNGNANNFMSAKACMEACQGV